MDADTCECGHPKSHHWHDRRTTPGRRVSDLSDGAPKVGKCLSLTATDCRCGRYTIKRTEAGR